MVTQEWTAFYVGILKQSFIYLFTVQNCGPRKSADCAQWKTLGTWNTNFYTEITSCRHTSWQLKGYAWTDWQFHVGWTRLHFPSHSQKITSAIKNTVDFRWTHSSGCLLHHQEIVDGIARSATRISNPCWCKLRNRSLMEASRQGATKGRW